MHKAKLDDDIVEIAPISEEARKAAPTGSSDLHQRLQTRGIDTVIITGCATSICCESTARDAMMLTFADVVSTADVTSLLKA